LEWLKENNIQYFFKPTQMLNACVFDLEKVKATGEIISEHGNAYFLKLY
jgi:hypothetical protein